jgi:hypothetical protein
VTFTLPSDPGLSGYIAWRSNEASIPESLRASAAWLSKRGFTVGIWRASPATLPHLPVDPGTTTGSLLTWWRKTSRGLVTCGSLWVADGVAASEIPFTSMLDSDP